MNIWHFVSIICVALCFFMFLYLKWYIKKRTSSSGLEEHRAEIYKLIADINSITDRDMQLVEDRVNKLKILLLDVDRRIALYEKDLENLALKEGEKNAERKKPETLYTSLGRGVRIALETPEIPPGMLANERADKDSPQDEIIFQGMQAEPPQVSQPAAIEPPREPALFSRMPMPVNPPSKKQIRAHIDLMVNEGLSPEEIASKLEISIAEVNLAMNLRRK